MKFDQALLAKMNVKKVQSIIDHIQIIITHHLGGNPVNLTIKDLFDEAHLNLRKVEYCVEAAAE